MRPVPAVPVARVATPGTPPPAPSRLPSPDAATLARPPFHVMTKPAGSACNLDCRYCFYLEKQHRLPDAGPRRMTPEVLESYVRQYIAAQDVAEVSFAWQGGEPTLLGIEFFREVVRLQQRHAGGKRIHNAFQTNGTLLDDAWGRFLAENHFLVGISIDGPARLHDTYRTDRGGQPTLRRVLRGLDALKRHRVAFNTLTVVNALTARHPQEVYRFLKKIGSRHLQFIPLVERPPSPSSPCSSSLSLSSSSSPLSAPLRHLLATPDEPGLTPTDWSVPPGAYGAFLNAIFDEWVQRDVGRIFIQTFEVTLAAWAGEEGRLCSFAETCGIALALEHNGDLYPCDHYVYPERLLGNILRRPLGALVHSAEQTEFGQAKRRLTRQCRGCDYRFACHGDCPKHRFALSQDGEPGQSHLCAGLHAYFRHTAPAMRRMVALLHQRRSPADIMRS